MKIKLVPFLSGLVLLGTIATPLAAQACSGEKEGNTSDSDSTEQTQASATTEATISL